MGRVYLGKDMRRLRIEVNGTIEVFAKEVTFTKVDDVNNVITGEVYLNLPYEIRTEYMLTSLFEAMNNAHRNFLEAGLITEA